MPETVRKSNIASFCEDKRNTVFLISILAGGTGLNLTAASKVVLVRAQQELAHVGCNAVYEHRASGCCSLCKTKTVYA